MPFFGKAVCICVVFLYSRTVKEARLRFSNFGEAVITWPGAARCRRTIADVDEPSKKRQLFIFGVPCVRLLSDDED